MAVKQRQQQYNDGQLMVYLTVNGAEKGDSPRKILKLRDGPFRYEERTVGMTRYWEALQNRTKIHAILRMQRIGNISVQDIIIPIDGNQYEIVQIQYPDDTVPQSMDLSLSRLGVPYEFAES